MRELTYKDLRDVHGGIDFNGYDFSFIVGNALSGLIIGAFFPGASHALGLTRVIASPALAMSALFGTYATARMGAKVLDNYIYSLNFSPLAPESIPAASSVSV